jgi:predicted ABC-type exoprotein transport system permease subunit
MIAMFIADICWVYYFIKIDERKSLAAGLWGSAIYICGAFTVTSYITNKTFVLAAILGSFLGTYVTIEYKKIKEKNKRKK